MKIDGKKLELMFNPITNTRSKEAYTFEGYAVTWDTIDSYNTTFRSGAFKKTISERGAKIKVLWNHNLEEPIGKIIEIREDAVGLFVKGQLTKGVAKAEDVYKNLRAGVINTLSFGFTVLQSTNIEDGIRQITEVKLYEISPVTFEANETAVITNVRSSKDSIDKNELVEAFNDINESIDEIAKRTSFTLTELNSLSQGKILPIESRKKLNMVELPESIRSAHQKVRVKVVEALCDELRISGFSEAEKVRFNALLGLQEDRVEKTSNINILSTLEKIRQNLEG